MSKHFPFRKYESVLVDSPGSLRMVLALRDALSLEQKSYMMLGVHAGIVDTFNCVEWVD